MVGLEKERFNVKTTITNKQKKHLVEACHFAIMQESSFIDAYKTVSDTDTVKTEAVAGARKRIKEWQDMMVYLESGSSACEDCYYAKKVLEKKKRCPNCRSSRIIMFDSNNDLCEKCGNIFQGS